MPLVHGEDSHRLIKGGSQRWMALLGVTLALALPLAALVLAAHAGAYWSADGFAFYAYPGKSTWSQGLEHVHGLWNIRVDEFHWTLDAGA